MKTYTVMNSEESGDYAIGTLVVQDNGAARLTMHGSRRDADLYRNPNAALADLREQCGWPGAYLQAVKAV